MRKFEHIAGLASIGYFNSANAGGFPIHPVVIPEGYELAEVLTAGEVLFEVDGVKHRFFRGTVFWHVAGDWTIWDTNVHSPYQCATFRFEVKEHRRVLPRVFQWRNSGQSLEDFIRYSRSWEENSPGDLLLCDYCLAQLAAQAAAPAEASSLSIPGVCQVPSNSKLLRLLDHIEKHISEPLNVELLSHTAGISRNQLFREFKKYLDCTPHNYLLERRIAKARFMLEKDTASIKEIAAECGFENIEVFYRCFRRITAMPPAIYRKKHAIYDFEK
jgi:AraC-like DNA-binding protein